jgi:hypothetical protein
MLHKNVLNSFGSGTALAANDSSNLTSTPRLTLVPAGGGPTQQSGVPSQSALVEILTISAKKCSSFLAEAAVLVLVFALLDRLIVKDRMEIGWVVSALGISVSLLAASIALDFTARRWLTRH